MVAASRRFFGEENIHQVLLTMGWTVAGLHSQAIFRREHSFPLLNGHGEPGSCKTLAAETALSLIETNWPQMGMLARVSVSAIYEHGSRTGSLPFIWDDPDRDRSNEELLKSWFNWKARVVRGNKQEPHSPLGVTSNHVYGGDQAAAYTRFVRIPFERATGGDNGAFQELQAAQREASGAFPFLLKLGYPADAIAQLERELLGHLPKAHARIAKSLAIVAYYAQKIVEMAGGQEDVKRWVVEHLCPAEDDADSAGDSLQDFIEKVTALEAQSLVGEWNKRRVQKRDGSEWVAIHSTDVWALVDRHFCPSTYNQKLLKSLLQKAGGVTDAIQSFVKSRDAQLAYERALINPNEERPPVPPELTSRRAWLLPIALFGGSSNDGPDGGNRGGDGDSGGNGPTPNPSPAGSELQEITSNYIELQKNVIRQDVGEASVSAPWLKSNYIVTQKTAREEAKSEEEKIELPFSPQIEVENSSVISVICVTPLSERVSEVTEHQATCNSGSEGERTSDEAQPKQEPQPEEGNYEPIELDDEDFPILAQILRDIARAGDRSQLEAQRLYISVKSLGKAAVELWPIDPEAYKVIKRWQQQDSAAAVSAGANIEPDAATAESDDFPKIGVVINK